MRGAIFFSRFSGVKVGVVVWGSSRVMRGVKLGERLRVEQCKKGAKGQKRLTKTDEGLPQAIYRPHPVNPIALPP
jgi:hypothetical protein